MKSGVLCLNASSGISPSQLHKEDHNTQSIFSQSGNRSLNSTSPPPIKPTVQLLHTLLVGVAAFEFFDGDF